MQSLTGETRPEARRWTFMKADDVRGVLTALLKGKRPAMPETWINDWRSPDKRRRLHEASGANGKTQIGAVIELHREWGWPDAAGFLERYVATGDEFDRRMAAGEELDGTRFGRSLAALGAKIEALTSYCRAHPNFSNAAYTEEEVGAWFLQLVLIRTLDGGLRERRVWTMLGGEAGGWRPTTAVEDTKDGLDFVHDRTATVVQVKPVGWHEKSALLRNWIDQSSHHADGRWLIECDACDDGAMAVFAVRGDVVSLSSKALLLAAAGPES